MAQMLSHIVPLVGVNKEVFYAIVSTKLTVDFRTSKTSGFTSKKGKNTFGKQLLTFLLVSFIFGKMIFEIEQPEVVFMMMFFILMIMVCMTLLTEFTTVLFSEDDNSIFLSRPISSKTLLVARLGHIILYIFAIAISFCLVPTIFTIIKYDVLTGLLFLISGLLTGWISLLITIFFYALLSKFITGEKFKDVLTYIQVAVAVVFVFIYQLVVGSDSSTVMLTDGLFETWWMYLLVPVWLAKITVFSIATITLTNWISLALVIGACMWGAQKVINLLSKEFDVILSSVSSASSKVEVFEKEKTRKWSLRKMLCVSDYEMAGWKLSSTSIGRDRQFKQAVFPLLAYGFIFIILAVVKNYEEGYSQTLENLSDPSNIFLMLLPTLFLGLPLAYLRYTSNSEAAWVYHLVAEDKQYHLLSGAVKAALLRFFVAPVAVLTILVALIWGTSMILPYLLGCSFVVLITLLSTLLDRELPLSMSYDQISKGATTLRMFGLMIASGLAFWFVYFIRDVHYIIPLGLIVIAIVFFFILMRAIRVR